MTDQEIEDRQHKELIKLVARAKARKMERERIAKDFGQEYEDTKLNWVEKLLIAGCTGLVVGLTAAYHWWVR